MWLGSTHRCPPSCGPSGPGSAAPAPGSAGSWPPGRCGCCSPPASAWPQRAEPGWSCPAAPGSAGPGLSGCSRTQSESRGLPWGRRGRRSRLPAGRPADEAAAEPGALARAPPRRPGPASSPASLALGKRPGPGRARPREQRPRFPPTRTSTHPGRGHGSGQARALGLGAGAGPAARRHLAGWTPCGEDGCEAQSARGRANPPSHLGFRPPGPRPALVAALGVRAALAEDVISA